MINLWHRPGIHTHIYIGRCKKNPGARIHGGLKSDVFRTSYMVAPNLTAVWGLLIQESRVDIIL